MLLMSIETLKEELRQLSRQEQESVRTFLLALKVEQDDAHRAELTAILDRNDPSFWIPLEDAKREWEQEDGGSEENGTT